MLSFGTANATFSVVAVDTVSGAVGGAGASCIDDSHIINSLHEMVGAIHTQAFWLSQNQDNADSLMALGLDPDSIIGWLANNDIGLNPKIRQYGVVTLAGSGASAAYTGENNTDYANHITGPGYAIQGNILIGPEVLDTMEIMYLATDGPIEEKLMAALEAADIPGADTRCLSCNKPAISAFIKVLLPGDGPDLYLQQYVVSTVCEVNPMPLLRGKYDTWKAEHIADPESCLAAIDQVALVANGTATAHISISVRNSSGEPLTKGLSFIIQGGGIGTIGPIANDGEGEYSLEITAPLESGSEVFDVTVVCVGEPIVLNQHLPLSYVSCGDADNSSGVDIDDVVYMIAYIFGGGPSPVPVGSGDSDCSGGVDIDDVVNLISYIFGSGHPPCDLDENGEPDC